jgi:hypothetical protein
MNDSWPTAESTTDSSVGPQKEYSLCLECSNSGSIHGSEVNRVGEQPTLIQAPAIHRVADFIC